MTQNAFLDLLLNWFPMLLLIGVWIYFMQQSRPPGGKFGRTASGKTQLDLIEETIAEQKRLNSYLEKLVTDYGARLERLESLSKQ